MQFVRACPRHEGEEVFTHNIYRNLRTRVLIVHDGNLLMNAPGSDGAGRDPYRCLPGGQLEPNESLFECGEREVLEETGLHAKVTSVAFLREWVVPKVVSLAEMKREVEAWGTAHAQEECSEHAYGLEVYLWAEIPDGHTVELEPKDAVGLLPEWLPLARIEREPLFPSELRALARDLLTGRAKVGVPSFVTGLGTPWDQPDYDCFRHVGG